MARTAIIGIRLSEQLKQALARAAKEENRSVSAYVERLIIKNLESKALVDEGLPVRVDGRPPF
jgi:hypothetical protein